MNSESTLDVADALLHADYAPSGPVRLHLAGGRIAAIEPLADKPTGAQLLAIPAIVDAHNHARPLSTTSLGCGGKPLELWLPQLATIPTADPYTAAAASFARSVQGGATSIMVHLTRPMGRTSLPDEAKEIARAAQDVGVSIALAIAMRDRNPLLYGNHESVLNALPAGIRQTISDTWLQPMACIEDQLLLVDAVADAVAGFAGHIDVQYGPTGVQWCSDALLSAIARGSAESGRRIHMHLLETKPQRHWADTTYPQGIVTYLNDIGMLSERLTLAHCVWATASELALIAQNDARIAVNVSSNLHLYSGLAPVIDMLGAGVNVAMGLDGCALDEDDDGLRELRLFHLFGHSPGFQPAGLTPAIALKAACRTGRAALGLPDGGFLAPGMPADLLLLDIAALNHDNVQSVHPTQLLFARASKQHIVSAYASGREVMRNGELTGVDIHALHESVRAEIRDGLNQNTDFGVCWQQLESALEKHYRGCC